MNASAKPRARLGPKTKDGREAWGKGLSESRPVSALKLVRKTYFFAAEDSAAVRIAHSFGGGRKNRNRLYEGSASLANFLL
jgi:hypothetical protein